ncbi:MAG: hypothetical protein IPJ12_20040 [Betaproteobacteria bacterium]|nr:hypothetical protein [Betaproteobacteria bacterium]
MMRRLFVPLILALSVVALPAQAQRGYGHRGYGHHGGGGSGWAGLAVFGALTGLAIMSERSRPVYVDPYYVGPVYSPQPVYIEQQPAPVAPSANASGSWYYCGSSAMYYPYTQACPEGWQAVPARP